MKPINLAEKFGLFSEHWAPKIIAQMNDYQFKLVFRDGEVSVGPGEMFVVPKGKEHKTSAKTECQAMLVEIAGTVNMRELFGVGTPAPTDRDASLGASAPTHGA
jgi:hypothetical protein